MAYVSANMMTKPDWVLVTERMSTSRSNFIKIRIVRCITNNIIFDTRVNPAVISGYALNLQDL